MVWKNPIRQKGKQANPRTWVLLGGHVASFNRNVVEHVRSTSFADGSRQEKARWRIAMGAHIRQEDLPWSRMMIHAK